MAPFVAMVVALLGEPGVREALAEVGLGRSPEDWIRIRRAAGIVGVRVKYLLAEGRVGKLKIYGPKGHQVIRRRDLDAWLESKPVPIKTKKTKAATQDEPSAPKEPTKALPQDEREATTIDPEVDRVAARLRKGRAA